MKSIDLTPSWQAVMPALIAALQGGTPAGKKLAIQELLLLAKKLDMQNAINEGIKK